MKSQYWNAVMIVAVLLFVVGFVGAMYFGEYATSNGIVQIPAEEFEFTICQWLMVVSVGLLVLCYFGSKRDEKREKVEVRRNAREARKAERFARETNFIDPNDFKEEV